MITCSQTTKSSVITPKSLLNGHQLATKENSIMVFSSQKPKCSLQTKFKLLLMGPRKINLSFKVSCSTDAISTWVDLNLTFVFSSRCNFTICCCKIASHQWNNRISKERLRRKLGRWTSSLGWLYAICSLHWMETNLPQYWFQDLGILQEHPAVGPCLRNV